MWSDILEKKNLAIEYVFLFCDKTKREMYKVCIKARLRGNQMDSERKISASNFVFPLRRFLLEWFRGEVNSLGEYHSHHHNLRILPALLC